MVQGMKDRLAKPGASVDIYNNISSEDRNLYLVGECQHLIFDAKTHQSRKCEKTFARSENLKIHERVHTSQ